MSFVEGIETMIRGEEKGKYLNKLEYVRNNAWEKCEIDRQISLSR